MLPFTISVIMLLDWRQNKMKCILMNKNKEVALIELDEKNNVDKIYEIYNIDYAPLSLKTATENKAINNEKALNDWFRGRGIPSWRKDLEKLIEKLNIASPDEILNKSYALSLSDQYWLKEEKQFNLKWEDINFFTNDFEYKGYLEVSLSSSDLNENIDLRSPNNTTDGMLQKAWVIENGKRVLIKGTYFPSRQEPINEWLVSEICKKLKIDSCEYFIDVNNNKIISKCVDFINENEEIISAYDIFMSKKKRNNMNDLEHYISILEENGIENAREQVEDMIFIDYLVMNIDRHLKNFGVIRNVETLKWERVTPVFDTGECMQCDKLVREMNFVDGKCKFFTDTNKKFSDLLKYVNIERYAIQDLQEIPDLYKQKLMEFKTYTEMTDERIESLYKGLEMRIENIVRLKSKLIESDIKKKINK